ncbi:hypothetical protein ACFMKD_22370, partial [Acinetobacter baumannii]
MLSVLSKRKQQTKAEAHSSGVWKL